ncbi:hypothetical protein [Actinokineospora sp. UTMC 2448]|uniref:hypothetical protein n=1 Tax=Actinokineospora sp. UTMC 2448 TaxID=2268449 RepID=UPI0021641E30|nr:hypothetical protein [Actinokineospora sp. UTMC 2448]UVS78380.1 hypothetical protein Actkin_02113 [Actinokineospora sp. UTMC 2448]
MATTTKVEEAQERYLALISALDEVQEALDETKSLLRRFNPTGLSWRVKDKREMHALRVKAQDKLDDLRETAKHYERDMVAREWRP